MSDYPIGARMTVYPPLGAGFVPSDAPDSLFWASGRIIACSPVLGSVFSLSAIDTSSVVSALGLRGGVTYRSALGLSAEHGGGFIGNPEEEEKEEGMSATSV